MVSGAGNAIDAGESYLRLRLPLTATATAIVPIGRSERSVTANAARHFRRSPESFLNPCYGRQILVASVGWDAFGQFFA